MENREDHMTFVVHWVFDPENRNQAQDRFKQTGAPPPEGVTMHSRWHAASGLEGWAVCESDDPVALCKWTQDWTDLLDFQVTPVINDEQIAQVIG